MTYQTVRDKFLTIIATYHWRLFL
uniref:Uncharacterized protein n=1 Tax=Rhizophora mucronata TaxID=61149 RepID=A0A2P2NXC1_RHIMU